MSWMSRLVNVFRASRLEREIDEELRLHVEERTEGFVREGLSPRDAEARARRQLGGPLRLREESRDVKLFPWPDSLVKDLRLGVRLLRKDAVVAGAAVTSLALAIGACTAAFSLIDALILRPLPVRAPEQLVYLTYRTDDPAWPEGESFSYPLFERLRAAARPNVELFAMLHAQRTRHVAFPDGGGAVEAVRPQFLSGEAFGILGIQPAIGRLIVPADDVEPGAHPVAVLSHAFWMRRFGGDASVVGRSFILDGRAFQIVGVADRTFTGVEPGRLVDLWVPNMMWDAEALADPGSRWLRILGRLKPGAEPEQARSVLQGTFTQFRQKQASAMFPPDEPRDRVQRFISAPLDVRSAENGPSALRRELERPLWILAVVVTLVLLIAGSNVANLLLARAAAREREMSLRLSIGAGRGRLIQQVLVESAVLAALACALGLLFAAVSAPTLVGMLAPSDNPAFLDLRVDGRMLAFLGLVGTLMTMLLGLASALRVSGVAPIGALHAASGRLTSRTRALRPLVATQVGFSVGLLFLASLLLLSFGKLTRVDLGFSTDGLLLLGVESEELSLTPDELMVALAGIDRLTADQRARLPDSVRSTFSRVRPAVEQAHAVGGRLLDEVRRMPGVQSASLSAWALFSGAGAEARVRLPGHTQDALQPSMLPVSPGFFETMGMRLVAGRGFDPRDGEQGTPRAVVVNEAFARHSFRGESVLGRVFERVFPAWTVQQEIVGVVADAKHGDLRHPARPTIYVPLRGFRMLQVRAGGDPLLLADTLRREIQAVHPSLRVTSAELQSTLVENTLFRERLLALLSGFFAVVGLALAAVGLYGVLGYAVAQRTKEIGIKLALGAQQLAVVRSIVSDVSLTMLIGAVGGLLGGLYLARFVRTFLFEVELFDFWSLALPIGALLLAGVLAAVLPARRAARVDPVVALRRE